MRTKPSGDDETFVGSRSKTGSKAKAKGKGSGKTQTKGKQSQQQKGDGEDSLIKDNSGGKWQQTHQQLAEQRDPANADGRCVFFSGLGWLGYEWKYMVHS